MLEVYTNNERHKLLEECKTNLSFLVQQENILLNIDEQEEEINDLITFSEGNTTNDNYGDANNENNDAQDNYSENINDEDIDIDEI